MTVNPGWTTDALPKRYIGAGALILDGEGCVLMLQPTYKSSWEIPGGVVEGNETPPAACRRECLEELGLDLEIGRLLALEHQTLPERGDSTMFIYDGGVLGAATPIELCEDEIASYRFVEPFQLEAVTTPRLAVRIRAAVRTLETGGVAEVLNSALRSSPS